MWQRATTAPRPSMSCSGVTKREDRPRRMAVNLGHAASSAGRPPAASPTRQVSRTTEPEQTAAFCVALHKPDRPPTSSTGGSDGEDRPGGMATDLVHPPRSSGGTYLRKRQPPGCRRRVPPRPAGATYLDQGLAAWLGR